MEAIRIVILCLAAAMICASLRVQRPEIAAAVSLAAGLVALMLTGEALSGVVSGLQRFVDMAALEGEHASVVLKAAGITIISELGVQICCDAGESALAGRIRLAARLVMLAMAMPMVMQLVDCVQALSG